MFRLENYDLIDFVLSFFGFVILVAHIAAYFKGAAPDENLTQWFLTILGVFIAKKTPSTIGK